MKPVGFSVFRAHSNFKKGNYNSDFGTTNTVVKIAGSVKKLGINYDNAQVVLYDKVDLLPIAIRIPNADGSYQFLGLNRDMRCFVVAFDNSKQYNAVIQDGVIPQ